MDDALDSQHNDPTPPPTLDSMAPPNRWEEAPRSQASSTRAARNAAPTGAPPSTLLLHAPPTKDAPPPKATARLATTTRAAPPVGKPLVPATERRSHHNRTWPRIKRPSETDRPPVAPDGTSAGREGRQFTVANVGNNGRIYLRPTVRPACQRYPQPSFTFPVTPPGTGGLQPLGPAHKSERQDQLQAQSASPSPWTPTSSVSPLPGDEPYLVEAQNPSRHARHRRAMSDSTMHDLSVANEHDKDAFKVVISKPGDERRPRTMQDFDANAAAPLLDINIPSWRIGTPRFTLRGTPIIRGSSYAPTEELRSSSVSVPSPSVPAPELKAKKPSPLAVHAPPTGASAQRGPPGMPSPRLPHSTMPSAYMSTHPAIEPAMFTDLTFKPACDDRCIVRYSPAGAVTAATPARLVAEITSPSFLDYELISDFFLTFRAFLEPADLLRMLVARLRWALARTDQVGMIVRVRTFVAIRHWILNYFLDDFVVEYDLRVAFCNLLNEFVNELAQDALSRKVQLKILAELKKCWRRVCAPYWDGPDFDDSLGLEVPIAPGGVAGNRDPSLDPGYWERQGMEPPQLDVLNPLPRTSTEYTSFYADAPRAAPIGDFIILGNRPGTPETPAVSGAVIEDEAGSPLSLMSMDVVSCSLPGAKGTKISDQNAAHCMTAHPVSSTSVNNGSGKVALTPRAVVGKRLRPTQTHKRNNSISDSLRAHGSDKSSSHGQDLFMAWPSAGSLVRGNLLPPGQAIVDYEPREDNGSNRQTTIFQPKGRNLPKERAVGGAMSGYGMKKLLGSVRRALRNRGQGLVPSHSNLMSISPVGLSAAVTNRLPGTAVVPQHVPRENCGRPPVRIDLLGAEVAEDFKKAVRDEEAAAEAERLGLTVPPNSAPPFGGLADYSAAHMDSSTFDSVPQNQRPRPLSHMGFTVGSKSIVIVDDTGPFGMPSAHGKPPPGGNSSVDTFADAFMPSCADPTPPNTPPSNFMRGSTPRPSSYLLHQHVASHPSVNDALPPFVPDWTTVGNNQSGRVSAEQPRPSLSTSCFQMRRPSISGGTFRMPRRNRSTGTPRSLNSFMHRQHLSLSSGVVPPPTVRSLDASTASGASALDSRLGVSIPAPLRALRRRPGGDLRAVTNIVDLDRPSLRESRSVGSLATYTESIRSSYLLNLCSDSVGHPDPDASHVSEERSEVSSVDHMAEKPAKRDLSLFNAQSSKPIMRPSFEKEAQKLAQIPDDEDDGGIESALLKLEGKYEKKLSKLPSKVSSRQPVGENDIGSEKGGVDGPCPETERFEKEKRHMHVLEEPIARGEGGEGCRALQELVGEPHMEQRPATGVLSFLSESSQGSYCSIPLLDRGLTDEGRSKTPTWEWADQSILRGSDEDSPLELENGPDTAGQDEAQHLSHLSFDVVEKTDSIGRIRPGESAPSEVGNQSFLDDGSDDTDLSSGLSADDGIGSGGDYGGDAFFSKYRSPDHGREVLGSSTSMHNTTQQMPLTQALATSPESFKAREKRGAQAWPRRRPLPTPEMTPVVPQSHGPSSPCDLAGPGDAILGTSKPEASHFRKYSVHLPFILAFDSDILAQQFTLIEKDALNEIDWRELVDMCWKNAARSDSRSWVDFLRNSDAQGVEVVIARFNIMVKWAKSEIVLTQHIEERARCIIKLIHIASHCRRYRNFATLAQLAIALSSNEVARLTKTWELVPAHDIQTLQSLEALVTPIRNFHAIRAEMEMGSDAGCVPFVGIYTHDLLYNAQRPSEIASSPTTAPLVNFERCRVGAAIVKTLLRLLEASTRYSFLPIEGITERCLWIGALSDDEIRRHYESLESSGKP